MVLLHASSSRTRAPAPAQEYSVTVNTPAAEPLAQVPSRPTIRDVAKAAGVSIVVVSYALNGRPGVSATTRDRVLRVADEYGWRPSTSARPDLLADDPRSASCAGSASAWRRSGARSSCTVVR